MIPERTINHHFTYHVAQASQAKHGSLVDRGANVTEKIQSTQQGHKKSHNVGTRLLSGFLVSFAGGVVEWNCWMKQQSITQKQGELMAIQTGCLGALHRSQSLTALNR